MEQISEKTNSLVTECGHCFHTKCMMMHVAHNGFGCPYCRAVMAEEPADDDDSEYYEISGEENERDAAYILDVQEEDGANDEESEDYVLRGMRMLFNRAEYESEFDEEDDEEDDMEEEENNEPKPSVEFIAEKLTAEGVTFEQLVKVILLEHDEYAFKREFDDISEDIFGKVRIVISNYVPEEAVPRDTLIVEPAEMGDAFVTIRTRSEPRPIFAEDILTSPTCPELQSLSNDELKMICSNYGIKTTFSTDEMVEILTDIKNRLAIVPAFTTTNQI